MTTQNHTIGTTWTETVMDGDDFLLSLPSASRFDVDVATTDTVVAPTVGRGHVIAADLRKSITRALLGPGYVWTKAPKQYTATLSTWSSDLAAILALEGLVGYWPTDPAYLYSDDAGTTLATVGGSVAYRANLISGGPAAVQSTPANQPVLHKYSLSDFYWLETDDGSSTLTATTGDLGASCTVAYADANGAVFTEGVTISSTYSTTPAVGYNSDFMIFNRALTAAEKTLITRHLTRDRDFVQRELLAISGLTGYWKADPQYLFEDSAGTTPASTNGTGPVGQWRAVGVTPTLTAVTVANSGFDADSDWTKGTGWAIGSGVATKTAGSAASLSQAITLTAGSVYLITWTLTRTAGTLLSRFTGGSTVSGTSLSASGTYTENLVAVTGNTTLEFYGDASFAGTVDDVSVVLLTGVVAVEATTALKPIIRKTPTTGIYWADSNTSASALNVALSDTVLGRRNLLTYSEDFSNAAWTKYGVLPFGGGSVVDAIPSHVGCAYLDLVIEDALSGRHNASIVVNVPNGSTLTQSYYVKQGPGDRYFGIETRLNSTNYVKTTFDLSNGTTYSDTGVTPILQNLGAGIYRASITYTLDAGYGYAYCYPFFSDSKTPLSGLNPTYTGDGTSGFYIGGAQLEFGSVATDYQKTTNVPAYCTLARATAEGVTFTDNAEISPTYNIAPAYGFNSDVAIFNRALTATEKALITRYMQRAVPMLGSNVVTNGTFDTDTTGWTVIPNGVLTVESGWGRLANNGVSSRYAQHPGLAFGSFFLAKAACRSSGVPIPQLRMGSGGVYSNNGTTSTLSHPVSLVGTPVTTTYLMIYCTTATTTGVYVEFDNITAQEIL